MGHPPPLPYDPPPGGALPPPRPARGPGTLVIVLVAAVVAVLLVIGVLAGYLVATGGDGDDPAPASAGPVDLREPLTFKLVAQVSAAPCTGGAVTVDGASECYTFGSDELTVRRLEGIRAVPPDPARGSPAWTVRLRLTSADAPRFGELTGKAAQAFADRLPAGRMGMLVGGTLVSEPAQVMQAISGGQVDVQGPADRFTRAYADGLVRRLAGS
ncbi:hypothetical protein [Spirillospora sp. CA-128828]|uniref:hypothetical protein n=1 Tax=Spirillospora sp. CA-128828 TaxID=3240033 RepID=UPI003D8DCB39